MNSLDRIELLLNRCGQTIMEPVDHTEAETTDVMMMTMFELIAEYLQCVHIIDRMETALENVCGERDYLAYRLRRYRDCQSCERVNECERTPDHCLGWVFGGVPDDWSVGDE